jgi:quercetin dioxygenase-like cupin family protein
LGQNGGDCGLRVGKIDLLEPLTRVKAGGSGQPYLERMNERPMIEPGGKEMISLPEETQFAPNGIVSRTLLRTETMRTVLFVFAEGQELTEHTSTQHALIHILSGECEFSLNGQPHTLKAGDFLYMPPNLAHAVRAATQFSMLLTLAKPAVTEKFNFPTETKT